MDKYPLPILCFIVCGNCLRALFTEPRCCFTILFVCRVVSTLLAVKISHAHEKESTCMQLQKLPQIEGQLSNLERLLISYCKMNLSVETPSQYSSN